MDVLLRIKRLAARDRLRFTRKAIEEMARDCLTRDDIAEAILNAPAIDKTLRSRSPDRAHAGERLYVITSPTYDGTLIYTKGKIVRYARQEYFYVLVSSKIATYED